MKYCNKCGARLLENAQICRKCGRRVEHMPIVDVMLYIFGILFFVIGIIDIVTGQSGGVADIWMCLAGLAMLPLPYKFAEKIIREFKKDYRNNGFPIVLVRIILPILFFVLMILCYKSYVKLVESDNKTEYKEVFEYDDGKVYLYGLSEFNVLVGQDYYSIGKAYQKNGKVLNDLVEFLILDAEYEDGAKLYKNKTYSVLTCANGDYVIGDPKLEFKKGFCDKEEVPLKKTDKESIEDDESKEPSKDKEESDDKNQSNSNESVKDDTGTGRDDSVSNDDSEANTNNSNSNNKNEGSSDQSNVSVSGGTITHQKLYDVYHNNMLDGRNRYYGKSIKVSTVFNYISQGTNGSYILNMEHVYCTSFASNKVVGSLADLDRGQSITISGTVNDWNETNSSLELKNCEITNK